MLTYVHTTNHLCLIWSESEQSSSISCYQKENVSHHISNRNDIYVSSDKLGLASGICHICCFLHNYNVLKTITIIRYKETLCNFPLA